MKLTDKQEITNLSTSTRQEQVDRINSMCSIEVQGEINIDHSPTSWWKLKEGSKDEDIEANA